jgi:thiosulfate/3-mercaptopyruvate sulfurtransferase
VAWQYFATCEDGATGDANWGCILDPERLSARLGEKGFDKDKEIVIFAAADQGWGDDGRIAWELIAAGYTNVKIVDGGYNALVAAGLETSNGGAEPVPVEVTIESIDQTHVINTDELVSDYDQYKIVDARADEEYNGEVLYGESKGGHLPGAIHIPFGSLFDENGMLKSNEELTAIFEEAGLEKDDKIVTYCTAGIRSAFMQLIMEDCGYGNVKNYDESFYRWSAVQDVE